MTPEDLAWEWEGRLTERDLIARSEGLTPISGLPYEEQRNLLVSFQTLCRHCWEFSHRHVNGKCLFAPTRYDNNHLPRLREAEDRSIVLGLLSPDGTEVYTSRRFGGPSHLENFFFTASGHRK